MVIVPLFAPTTDGVPVIVNVAEAPAATGLAGLNALTAKPEAPVIEVTFNGAFPEFVMVIVTGAPATPTIALPKASRGALLFGIDVAPFETAITG